MEGGGAPYSCAMDPSGSYILIIVSQPVTDKDKETILDRLNKGLLSWDVESTGCDLNGLEVVCSEIGPKHLDDTDVLIQHSTERLGVEVLVNPTVSTLKQCVKNLLSTSTGHKHLIHSGYTFAGSGSWILQNGAFSYDDFLEIFQQADVQSQKHCNINIHCMEVGQWKSANFTKDTFTKVANVAFNPPQKVQSVPGSEFLLNCLKSVLNSQDLEEIMEASPFVGNIRINRPTLYMFPAGQGDCALFGINGFNMLIDGGFNRKPCSWEFIRHLDRLDTVLVTRLCENNVCGLSTLMKRKSINNTFPQIGYVFCNIPENKTPSPKEDKAKDDLIVSVVNEGHTFIQTLNDLKLKPHQCWKDSSPEPFVLYHKVGHGTLEMHVLSPPKDSKEMKEFILEWSSFKETFSSTKAGLKGKALEPVIPLSHATSICAVLIWRPADPKDTITRILFPGSAPQNKIFESLEKLKTLDVLSHPVVTKASLAATKPLSNKVEKSISRTSLPNRKNAASPAPSVTSIASRNGDVGAHKAEVKRVTNVVKKEIKKDIKKEFVPKEKKEVKSDVSGKKDVVKKDTSTTEVKKEVKKIVKKELKTAVEKKPEVKTTIKKDTATISKSVTEVKKTASTALKKSTTLAKKETKPVTATKAAEVRKSAPAKLAESKSSKDTNTKKVSESKTVAKTKPKTAAPKASAPKTKPIAVPKPGTKVTKAVAASSIVASAVAVTVAAFELNEKKDEIVIDDAEAEVTDIKETDEKEPEVPIETKELDNVEKHEEEVVVSPLPPEVVSPIPPEAVSPTPSESVSLTPSDTLSSAPLETVSPTPPLANEPMSTEEKDVNEIKDIEQDMPSEAEVIDEIADDEEIQKEVVEQELEETQDRNEIEEQLAKLQQGSDAMSASFIESKDFDSDVEEKPFTAESSKLETQAVKPEVPAGDNFSVEAKSEREEGYIFESKEINVDDQLAQMSMEGSFCAGGGYGVEDEHLERIESTGYTNESFDQKQYETAEYSTQEIVKENLAYSTEELESKESNIEDYSKDFNSEQEKNYSSQDLESKVEKDEHFTKDLESNTESMHALQLDEKYVENDQHNLEEIGQNKNEIEDFGAHDSEVEIAKEQDFNKYDVTAEQDTEKSFASAGIEDKFQDIEKSNEINDFETTEPTEVPEISETKDLYEIQEKEIISTRSEEYGSSFQDATKEGDDQSLDEQYDQQPELEALKETISRTANEDFEISRNIINDADMQETSVDEPEEINRKESAVSITLNDEELDDDYAIQRRKSGTESEDDVDLQQFMLNKEKVVLDQDKLTARQEQDSDDEDVVKSPTPHAIVDYEDNMDNLLSGQEVTTSSVALDDTKLSGKHLDEKDLFSSEKQHSGEKDIFSSEKQHSDEKEMFSSEKHYFDEKDHDSTEEQDVDDGEMIRHPTPPEMASYGDEMRDPIGPHFIVNPNLKPQGNGITEQPLYEEAEDDDDGILNRSESPVVEQPVFGNVGSADFPELVTVSGGTTPSEPQSPKAGFDGKKFGTETDIMEALSEHDLSESSTHSPLIKDTAAFDLPTSPEKQTLKTANDDEYDHDTETMDYRKENLQNLGEVDKIEHSAADKLQSSPLPSRQVCDAQSDDESYSQNEKSETRSEKSDDDDEKSNTRHDDKSDMHDDRSDNQFDGKSDAMDDERRSDIHDDDLADSHHDDYYDDKRSGEHHDKQETDKIENFGFEASHQSLIHEESFQQSHQHSEHAFVRETDFKSETDVIDESMHKIDDSNDFNTDYSFQSTTVSHEMKESDYEMQKSHDQDFREGVLDGNKFDVPSGFTDQEKSPIHEMHNYSDYYMDQSEESKIYGESHSSRFPDNTTLGYAHEESELADSKYGYDYTTIEKHIDDMPGEIISKPIDESDNSHIQSDDKYCEEETTKTKEYESLSTANNAISSNFDITSSETSNLETHQYEESLIKKLAGDLDIENKETSKFVSDSYTMSHELESANPDDTNYNYMPHDTQSFDPDGHLEISSSKYENSYGSNLEQKFSEISSHSHALSHSEYEVGFSESSNLKFSNSASELEEGGIASAYANSNEQLLNREIGEDKITAGGDISHVTHSSEIPYTTSDEHGAMFSNSESELSKMNGKEQTSWSHTSEYAEHYSSPAISNVDVSGYSTTQQEASYIINSRFHSDSPEDNVMRSDSSPDVPYPPSSINAKNSMIMESEEMIQNQEGYHNMNLPQTGGLHISPNNKPHNDNRDDPYGESSEDEDSSSVPGNVSPYAYTNKAYAKEEEDIDGNHIYKESERFEKGSEILKQVDYDGNNSQSISTQQVSYSQGYEEREYTGSTNYDFKLEEWEKPMGLPTPPDSTKAVTKKPPTKQVGKSVADSNGKSHSPSVASRMSSPLKKPKPKTTKECGGTPVYVDLAYVPHHGEPNYCDAEFFKKIRARYYVFSGINPSKEVLNALLEAKKTWKEEMEVTIIPTYETETLGYWVAQNQDDLVAYSIEVAPSASRCLVNLQDHETSISAYRLEF